MEVKKKLFNLSRESQVLQEKLTEWIQQFAQELTHYRTITDIHEEKIVVDNHPFLLNEIALVSAFSTALIRNDRKKEITCLQEYGVYNNKNEFQGRADLLIASKHWNILVEAKKWEVVDIEKWYKKGGNHNYFKDGDIIDYLNEVKNEQLDHYANAEKEYYKNKDSYKMILVFEELVWPEDDKKYMEDLEAYNTQIDNYFYFFLLDIDVPESEYRGKKRALEIYGLLEKINP